jgi:hypothetical protein
MPAIALTRSGGDDGTSCRQPFPGRPGLSQPCSQWRLSGRCAATAAVPCVLLVLNLQKQVGVYPLVTALPAKGYRIPNGARLPSLGCWLNPS